MAKKGKPAPEPDDDDIVDRAVREAVDIDPLAFEDEFKKLPSKLATFNERYARALKRHLTAKANKDRTYYRRMLDIRVELEEKGEKTTEANIKAHVEADAKYAEAVTAAISAEVEKARLWGVLDALRSKREALISIGAHLRVEMQGAPSIRGERRGARDVEENYSSDSEFGIEVDDD